MLILAAIIATSIILIVVAYFRTSTNIDMVGTEVAHENRRRLQAKQKRKYEAARRVRRARR